MRKLWIFFVAAVLGELDIAKSTLAAYPNFDVSKGPHELKLLHHGPEGDEQSEVEPDYLNEIVAE